MPSAVFCAVASRRYRIWKPGWGGGRSRGAGWTIGHQKRIAVEKNVACSTACTSSCSTAASYMNGRCQSHTVATWRTPPTGKIVSADSAARSGAPRRSVVPSARRAWADKPQRTSANGLPSSRSAAAAIGRSTGRPDPSGEAALEAPSDPGHRVREDEVDDRDEKVELERPDLAVIDDLRRLGEVHVADDGGERSVLEEHDHLRDERRHHVADRLREDHVAHRLSARQAESGRGLDLAPWHRLDAGPHDLAEVRRLEDDERRERDAVLGDGEPQELGNDEPDPEDHHDERHAAEELDVERRRHADPPRPREPRDPDEDAEDEAEHDGGDREPQRAAGEAPEAQEPLDHEEREVVDDDREVEHGL